jgi:hypothetical protein
MWPIQLAFLRFTVCRIFFSSLTICNASSFLTRLVQLISIFIQHQFQNFPGVSDVLSAVFKFQHLTKLCSKCSTLPVNGCLCVDSVNEFNTRVLTSENTYGKKSESLYETCLCAYYIRLAWPSVCPSIRPTDRLFICETTLNIRKLCAYVVLWSRSWNIGVLRGYVCRGYGTARHGTVRYFTARYCMVRYGAYRTVWDCLLGGCTFLP